ncbi:hypothetical protein IAD21_00938 [Abditibacteriota bacterium]|nr:hypothetical protein IAD21_00938 [Abditibacteriota bacterium]
MKYHLIPDSRRPRIVLVCDENGAPIEYPDGRFQKHWPFQYEPSTEEKALLSELADHFPTHTFTGISPQPGRGRMEGREK